MLLLIPSILVILFRFTLNSNTSYVAINRQRKRHFSASAQIQIHRMLLLIKQGGAKSYLKRRIQIHRMLLLIVLFHWININARRIQIHRMLLLIKVTLPTVLKPKGNSNTSYVAINRLAEVGKISAEIKFKYIVCCY